MDKIKHFSLQTKLGCELTLFPIVAVTVWFQILIIHLCEWQKRKASAKTDEPEGEGEGKSMWPVDRDAGTLTLSSPPRGAPHRGAHGSAICSELPESRPPP